MAQRRKKKKKKNSAGVIIHNTYSVARASLIVHCALRHSWLRKGEKGRLEGVIHVDSMLDDGSAGKKRPS